MLSQDDALPYQVWLPQVEHFRRYRQSQTEGQMDRQGDSSVLALPSFVTGVWWIKNKKPEAWKNRKIKHFSFSIDLSLFSRYKPRPLISALLLSSSVYSPCCVISCIDEMCYICVIFCTGHTSYVSHTCVTLYWWHMLHLSYMFLILYSWHVLHQPYTCHTDETYQS